MIRSKKNARCSRKHCSEQDSHEEPSVVMEASLFVEEVLSKTRRLLLVGEIDEISSTHVCSYLQAFSLTKEPVFMYIHSPGGCMASGYAIIDQMLACSCPVYTIVRGQACSMGAIIAAFGEKGHRYAMPNSFMMMHSAIIQHQPNSLEQTKAMVDYISRDYKSKVADLAKRMKLTKKQLTLLMVETRWMDSKQAIQIGLIDGIWTPRHERAIGKGR